MPVLGNALMVFCSPRTEEHRAKLSYAEIIPEHLSYSYAV